MNKQFLTILINDIRVVIKSKQYLVLVASLLLYSLYINFIYVNTNVDQYQVYVLEETQSIPKLKDVVYVDSEQSLYEKLNTDKEAIGIVINNHKNRIVLVDSGSNKINNSKQLVAKSKLNGINQNVELKVLNSIDFKLHKRIEMTSVIVFFEITAVSFLTIAAIFFKEKELGIVKLHSVTPIKKQYLILTKILVFLLLEMSFVLLLGFININTQYFIKVLPNVLLQVFILSPIMVMLGFIFSLLYKNFKQFIFAYTALIIMFTSPVFLFVNTPFKWSGIKLFPTYYLYTNLHKAFFNNINLSLSNYLLYGFILIALYFINNKMLKKEMKRS